VRILALVIMALSTHATLGQAAEAPQPLNTDKVHIPQKGSAEEALRDGLKLIAAGEFKRWRERYCHEDKLCRTKEATKSLFAFNLPAAQKLVAHCLRGEQDEGLSITRRVSRGEELKLFLACNPKGMPRPFSLEKEGRAWKFTKI